MKHLKDYIEETNEAFNKSSPAQKRVMIAKDVLVRIESGNINIKRGNFLSKVSLPKKTGSFKDILNNHEGSICEVCAKGALFCSIIGRVNKFTIDQLIETDIMVNSFSDPAHQELKKYFSEEQIDLIEIALEEFSFLNVVNNDDFYKAQNFNLTLFLSNNENRASAENIMIAICKNIIENNGTFNP